MLEQGSICETGDGRIEDGDLAAMTAIWRNRGRAFTHLLARIAEEAEAGVPEDEIDAAEARIVAQRFGGDPAAYNAAVAALGLNTRLARALIADQLRARLPRRARARRPPLVHGGRQPVRRHGAASGRAACGSRPPRRGCADETTGTAIEGLAPSAIFQRQEGPHDHRPHRRRALPRAHPRQARSGCATCRSRRSTRSSPTCCASAPASAASAAGCSTLQRNALDTAVCQRDLMPRVAAIDAARAVPFLNLSTLR